MAEYNTPTQSDWDLLTDGEQDALIIEAIRKAPVLREWYITVGEQK